MRKPLYLCMCVRSDMSSTCMVIVHARAINVVKIISVDLLLCTYRSTAALGEIVPWGWDIDGQSRGVACQALIRMCTMVVYTGWCYLLSMNASFFACQYYDHPAIVLWTVRLDNIWSSLFPGSACRVIDSKVVKSPPMPPPVPRWGEVGHYFDRCINSKI